MPFGRSRVSSMSVRRQAYFYELNVFQQRGGSMMDMIAIEIGMLSKPFEKNLHLFIQQCIFSVNELIFEEFFKKN